MGEGHIWRQEVWSPHGWPDDLLIASYGEPDGYFDTVVPLLPGGYPEDDMHNVRCMLVFDSQRTLLQYAEAHGTPRDTLTLLDTDYRNLREAAVEEGYDALLYLYRVQPGIAHDYEFLK